MTLTARQREQLLLLGMLLGALVIRLLVVGGTGYPSDPHEVTRWAEGVRTFGLTEFYRNIQGGYYPAVLYVLAPLAGLFRGEALYLVVKGLVIPFDLAIGVALYLLVRRHAEARHALLAAALYLFNPASVLGGAYWGQVDAIGALGMLLALIALGAGRNALAGGLAVVSALVKATFGIVGLVVAAVGVFEVVRRRDWRPGLFAMAGGIAGYVLVSLPIRLGPLDYLGLVREGGVRFPFTSLYALNPWFVAVGFFKPDDQYVAFGAALLVCGIVAALAPLSSNRRLPMLLAVGGALTLAFYFLPTRVHERYLFPAIVLFAPFAAVRPRMRWPYISLSLLFAIGLGYALWTGSESHVDLPGWFERTVYSLPGMGLVAVALMASSALLVWRLFHGEASLSSPREGAARVSTPSPVPAYATRVTVLLRTLITRLLVGRDRRSLAVLLSLGAVAAFVAVGTSVELTPVLALNDEIYHLRLIVGADQMIGRGNPFDFWVPELEQGFPVFLYYQQLAHLAIVVLNRVTFGLIGLHTLFDLAQWILMLGLPFTAYRALRWAGLPMAVAAFAGAASALLSSSYGFGLEYDNYLWRGYGLYTQLWGAHLAFIAFAAIYRLQERDGRVLPAVFALTALALTHLVYGYMVAVTAVVLTLAGINRSNARVRLVRLALVGGFTAAASLYMLVPFAVGQAYLLVSTYLPQYRFDGFGMGTVLGSLLKGDLLDSRRIPVFTVLAGAGVVAAVLRRQRDALLVLLLFVVWLVLFAGKPVTSLLPLSGGLPVHRFLGSVQIFGVILAGFGAVWMITTFRAFALPRAPRLVPLIAPVFLALVFLPVAIERADYFRVNADWVQTTNAAVRGDADAALVLNRLATLPPGRVHAGIRETWGERLNFGIPFRSVHFYDLISVAGYDTVRPPAYSFALESDTLFDFNAQRPAIYDLWNARYVIAPTGETVPADLQPLLQTRRYTLYEAPTSGYGQYVALAGRVALATQPEILRTDLQWLRGDGPERRAYLRYDYPSSTPVANLAVPGCNAPRYAGETITTQRLTFDVGCDGVSTFVIKETFHPNLRVTADGVQLETFMVSPGFLAVTLPPGNHRVVAEYVSAGYKTPLILFGVTVLVLAFVFRKRIEHLAK